MIIAPGNLRGSRLRSVRQKKKKATFLIRKSISFVFSSGITRLSNKNSLLNKFKIAYFQKPGNKNHRGLYKIVEMQNSITNYCPWMFAICKVGADRPWITTSTCLFNIFFFFLVVVDCDCVIVSDKYFSLPATFGRFFRFPLDRTELEPATIIELYYSRVKFPGNAISFVIVFVLRTCLTGISTYFKSRPDCIYGRISTFYRKIYIILAVLYR